MFCEQCGARNDGNARFCTKCGSPLPPVAPDTEEPAQNTAAFLTMDEEPVSEEPVSEEPATSEDIPVTEDTLAEQIPYAPPEAMVEEMAQETKKGGKHKVWIPLVILAVVLVAAVVLLFKLFGSLLGASDAAIETYSAEMLSYHYDEEMNETAIYCEGQIVATIEGNYDYLRFSLPRDVMTLVDEEGVLYYITPDGAKEISDDVYAVALSDDGSGVAYLCDVNEETYSGVLYLYEAEQDSSTMISDDADSVVISPDGSSVAFSGNYDLEEYSYQLYLCVNGGEIQEIQENALAIALSNDGEYFYYATIEGDDELGKLYLLSEEEEILLADGFDYYSASVIFNRDYSQILFTLDEATYFSQSGGEKIGVFYSVNVGMITPYPVGGAARYLYSSIYFTVYDTDSLLGKVYGVDSSLQYLDQSCEREQIADSYLDCCLTSDCETLVFVKENGKLYRVDQLSESVDEDLIYDGETLAGVWSNVTGQINYLLTESNGLYAQDEAEIVMLAEQIESLTMTEDGEVLYFVSGGTLYYSENGKEGQVVTGAETEVVRVSRLGNIIIYFQGTEGDGYTLYYSQKPGEFSLMIEKVFSTYL